MSEDQGQGHQLRVIDLGWRHAADQIVELVADMQFLEQDIDQLARPGQVMRAVDELVEDEWTNETSPVGQVCVPAA
jgi:hypothetical protein